MTVATDALASPNIRNAARFPIEIDLNANGTDVKVARKSFKIQYQQGDVDEYNKRFIETLEEICSLVDDDLTLSDDDYAYSMEKLRKVGAAAYAFLRKPGIADYIELLEKREARKGISLDFTFPAGMNFIWQMMYTGGSRENPVLPEKFWGFHYPIGNLFWDSYASSAIELKSGIFASTHHELKCSLIELKNLQDELNRIRGNHELEVQRLDEAKICESLCSDELFKYFNRNDFKYGVVHFACHCFNPLEGASQASLLMTAKEIKLELTLEQFNTFAAEACRFQSSPLVFLNACESATPLHLLQSLNFPWSLINFGAGGVIATVCTMPDNFASAFATEFYKRLLTKSLGGTNSSIGETLMETSCYFLKEKQNPLGLAYGLYSATNQQLEVH
jgi:hypothetical protein